MFLSYLKYVEGQPDVTEIGRQLPRPRAVLGEPLHGDVDCSKFSHLFME